jgi:prevent-host-death family protein
VGTIGVRELRQNASEILREVEAGTVTTVTVSGRPVARLVPVGSGHWTSWDLVAPIFAIPGDPTLAADLKDFDSTGLSDPWEQ